MVAEADESDGSFLKMKPTIAVVTNIDREHLDHYRDLGEIQDAFVQFLSRVPFYGAAVVCLDEPNLRAILPRIDRKIVTYGLSSDADLVATGRRFRRVRLVVRGAVAGREARGRPAPGARAPFGLQLAGRRRRGPRAGRPASRRSRRRSRGSRRSTAASSGRARRSARRSIDDYGHHPTEIQATLAAAREGFGARTVVAFQPHRYSRTRALLEEFGRAFVLADRVIVTSVYAAGEAPLPDVDGAAVADALVRHGHPAVSVRAETRPDPQPPEGSRASGRPRHHARRGRHLEGRRRVPGAGVEGGLAARPREEGAMIDEGHRCPSPTAATGAVA